jgi:holo-[acyl-carrier protein] synthase
VAKTNTARVNAPSPPLRVGIDLVEVAGVRDSLRAHAERYLNRIYTEREVADCGGAAEIRADSLAARFAAKEATLKILGPAQEGVGWRSIEVVREPAGLISLELSGRAAELAREARISALAVSLSHEGDLAGAVVVATLEPETG